MSITPVESWMVDSAEVGLIYPFVGSESLLVILLLVVWLGWHCWQIKHEKKQETEVINKIASSLPSSE